MFLSWGIHCKASVNLSAKGSTTTDDQHSLKMLECTVSTIPRYDQSCNPGLENCFSGLRNAENSGYNFKHFPGGTYSTLRPQQSLHAPWREHPHPALLRIGLVLSNTAKNPGMVSKDIICPLSIHTIQHSLLICQYLFMIVYLFYNEIRHWFV